MSSWRRPGRGASLAWVTLPYLLCLPLGAAVVLAWPGDGPWSWAWALLAADVAATVLVFAFSRLLDNSSVYDPYWSVAPPVLLLGGMALTQASPRGWLLLAALGLWSLRLTANWARGWPDLSHEDWRYVDLRRKTGRAFWLVSLLGIHLFPTLCVALGMLPVAAALPSDAPLGTLDLLGAAVILGGTALEWFADEQARAFKRTAGPGDLCDTGLWAWSRHPNYLGEILVWVGAWLVGLAAAPELWAWTALGPLAMIGLFVGISIPMQERRAFERRRGWAEYAARTPALLLWPPRGHRPPRG